MTNYYDLDDKKTSRKFSRLKLNIFRSNFHGEETLKTSPNNKNNKFFETPIINEEKTFQEPLNIEQNSKKIKEQNYEKDHGNIQRTQRKSFSYVIPQNMIVKKLKKSKASKNIFQISEENKISHLSSNKTERETQSKIPLNLNNLTEDQKMSYLNFPPSKISILKSEGKSVEKLSLRRNSASLKKNETNISIEKNLLTPKNGNHLRNNRGTVIISRSHNNMTEKSPQKKFSESSRSLIPEEESPSVFNFIIVN